MSKYAYPESKLPTPQNSKLLALVGENKRVLEIGCALGFHTRSMREMQGCRVTGIEIDAKAAEATSYLCERMIVGDIENLDLAEALPEDSFDVVTFGDVLEHLRDPRAALVKVRPLIAPGGYVVASIPNITHASVLYELAQGRFSYRKIGLLDDTHIRFFSKQSIYDTFEAAGYQILTLDRNRIAPRGTEFETQPETFEDRQFLRYAMDRNPDADTYQFIVKATPMTSDSLSQAAFVEAAARVRTLEHECQVDRMAIKSLETQLDTIRGQWLIKAILKIQRLLGKQL